MIKHFSLRFSLFLVALDTILVILALQAATVARIWLPFGLPGTADLRILPIPVYIIAVVVHNVIYAMLNVHSPRQVGTLLRELQVITGAALLGWLMFLGALYMTYRDVSRLQTVYFLAGHIVLIYGSRVALRLWYLARGRRRISTRGVLIIGSTGPAEQMYSLVEAQSFTGLQTTGVIPVGEPPVDAPVVGELDQLEDIISACAVTEVIIAVERNTEINLQHLIRRLQALPVNIRLVPHYSDLAFLQVNVEDFSGIPLLTLKEPVLTPHQRLLKRL
ncbi:MAG: hypothetical protein AAF125_12940, partial [Chloroflexota bacterium]